MLVPHLISPTYKRYHLQLLQAPSKPPTNSLFTNHPTACNTNYTKPELYTFWVCFLLLLFFLSFLYLPAVYQISVHTTGGQSRPFLPPFPARMYICCYTKSKRKVSHTQFTHTIERAIVSLKNNPYFPFRRSIVPSWLEDKSTFKFIFLLGTWIKKRCIFTSPLICSITTVLKAISHIPCRSHAAPLRV
jgi:hypothetical protein